MKIDQYGYKRPETSEDVKTVLSRVAPKDTGTSIYHNPYDATEVDTKGVNATGYVAELLDNKSEEVVAETVGFERRNDLVKMLIEAGIDPAEIDGD